MAALNNPLNEILKDMKPKGPMENTPKENRRMKQKRKRRKRREREGLMGEVRGLDAASNGI